MLTQNKVFFLNSEKTLHNTSVNDHEKMREKSKKKRKKERTSPEHNDAFLW